MAATTRKTRNSVSAAKGKKGSTTRRTRKVKPVSETSDFDDNDDAGSDSTESADKQEYDSDALDEDHVQEELKKKRKKPAAGTRKSASPKKKRKVGDSDDDVELEEGERVVGVKVKAPTTGLVPPGQVSKNTLDFLAKLKDPKFNDRTWFKLNDLVFRAAEKEWKDFIEAFTDNLIDVDPQIPYLPPKDVIHRIYRDVRFSNDKTPYKKNFCASFSRSGRKGIFAHYHVSIQPGNASMIAAGSWCPGKNELATIRANIQRNPRRLRNTISTPDFVEFFGEAKAHPKGERQNIFGGEDELKNAPKGVDKGHKDIDLLKCRSFAVIHRFSDSEVLAPDFKDQLAEVAKVMRPFVHCLNDMMTVSSNDEEDEDDEEAEEDAQDDDEED